MVDELRNKSIHTFIRYGLLLTVLIGIFAVINALLTFSTNAAVASNLTSNRLTNTAFKRSDVLISPRGTGTLTSFGAYAEMYKASGIAWTYAWANLIPRQVNGTMLVQCALPVWVPSTLAKIEEAYCHDSSGNRKSVAITSNGKTTTFSVADISSVRWQEYELSEGKKMIDAGCTMFMQDDFVKNAQHLCHLPNKTLPDSKAQTIQYYARVHNELRAYANSKGISLSFSGNMTNNQWRQKDYSWLFPYIDYPTTEFYVPQGSDPYKEMIPLYERARKFLYPSVVTIASDSRLHNQRVISSAYALGMVPIVPFDVFVGAGQPRFTGLPADYQKYFNLVTLNKNLFDVYTPAVVTDSTYSAVIPADGFVSSIEPVPGDATRARIGWTRQAEFKTMPKGTSVRIGGVPYTTITASTVGYIYIPADTRIKVGDGVNLEYYRTLAVLSKSASGDALAHLVNWQLASRRIQIAIDASQKSTAPSVMFSPNIPQGKALKFSKLGNRWISETIELSDWLIIK